MLEEWREEGAASAGSEEVLVEWREEGAAPVGSEEGVVPAELEGEDATAGTEGGDGQDWGKGMLGCTVSYG